MPFAVEALAVGIHFVKVFVDSMDSVDRNKDRNKGEICQKPQLASARTLPLRSQNRRYFPNGSLQAMC